jgi:hypothetical protein
MEQEASGGHGKEPQPDGSGQPPIQQPLSLSLLTHGLDEGGQGKGIVD